MARQRPRRCGADTQKAEAHALPGRPLLRAGDRAGLAGRTGQNRDGRADRIPAGSGCRIEGVALMSHEMEALTGLVRGTMAGILLLMFIGLWFWVYSRSRRAT